VDVHLRAPNEEQQKVERALEGGKTDLIGIA
jgi:hypothetical protein